MRPITRSRLAAEMYLAGGGNGWRNGVTLAVCAKRFGLRISTVHTYVMKIRNERRQPDEPGATPEDECTL